MSDYEPLKRLFESHPGKAAMMDFGTVEAILRRRLPESARKEREWWANDESSLGLHCRSWLDVGWRVDAVLMDDGIVVFRRA